MTRRLFASLTLVALLTFGGATAAIAEPPPKACWGVVTGQAARTGVMGQHASEQSEPRAGLGNLSRDLGFDHLSDLGAFLAEIDGIDETSC